MEYLNGQIRTISYNFKGPRAKKSSSHSWSVTTPSLVLCDYNKIIPEELRQIKPDLIDIVQAATAAEKNVIIQNDIYRNKNHYVQSRYLSLKIGEELICEWGNNSGVEYHN